MSNGGINDLRVDAAAQKSKDAPAADTLQKAAQLRLEEDDQCQQSKLNRVLQQKIDHRQIQPIRDPKRKNNDYYALCDPV